MDQPNITELCTLDGSTYVSVPDGVILPEQPVEIAASVVTVVLDDVLRERIKAASPHSGLVGQRMIDTIRAAYSIDDEMYFARIGVGAAIGMYVPSAGEMEELAVFGNFVEGVREWGRSERAKLGL
jgi:hypothetical protein